MTFGQIYNNVCRLVYGDVAAASPPQHEVLMIQDLIMYRHKFVQMGHNFWFQNSVFDTTFYPSIYEYEFLDNVLDILKIQVNWNGNGQTFEDLNISYTFSDIEPTSDGLGQVYLRRILKFDAAQYDKNFSQEAKLGRFVYRIFFDNNNYFDNIQNAVTQYLAWAIIFYVTGDLFLKRDDKSQSNVYYQLAEEALFNVEREDFEKRQRRHVIF